MTLKKMILGEGGIDGFDLIQMEMKDSFRTIMALEKMIEGLGGGDSGNIERAGDGRVSGGLERF